MRESIAQFLDNLQMHFNRTLTFAREIGLLLDETKRQGLDDLFRDALFQAKFATKTREVMDRIGRGGEGFDKLSAEFQASIEKTSALLKTIVKESPDETKQLFVDKFFALDQNGFSNFLTLLQDLSWLKNWELDGNPLPLEQGPSTRSRQRQGDLRPLQTKNEGLLKELSRIRLAASFGLILMLLLFVVDPPVLTLGWGLAIAATLMFISIAALSHALIKNVNKP